MSGNPKIHFIPAVPKREKRVAIYARVSTNNAEKLKSLAVQVSAFTRLVATKKSLSFDLILFLEVPLGCSF